MVTNKIPSPSKEDIAFSEYSVFHVSAQLKLKAVDFTLFGYVVSTLAVGMVTAVVLCLSCVDSVRLSEVITFVPQDMQKESSGLTGWLHVGQDLSSCFPS